MRQVREACVLAALIHTHTHTANLLKTYVEMFPEVMQAFASLKGFDEKLYSEDIFSGGDADKKMKEVRSYFFVVLYSSIYPSNLGCIVGGKRGT